MLDLTENMLVGLAEGEARNFVSDVQRDIVQADPRVGADPGLSERLWRAFQAARKLGISQDTHLVQFLKVEAYSPSFYEKPAFHRWITTPVGTPDERFEDYVREIMWRSQHPESLKGGMTHGRSTDPTLGGRSGGSRSRFVGYWNRLVGRGGSSGNG